jgi:hypothetical protein
MCDRERPDRPKSLESCDIDVPLQLPGAGVVVVPSTTEELAVPCGTGVVGTAATETAGSFAGGSSGVAFGDGVVDGGVTRLSPSSAGICE